MTEKLLQGSSEGPSSRGNRVTEIGVGIGIGIEVGIGIGHTKLNETTTTETKVKGRTKKGTSMQDIRKCTECALRG